MQFHFYRRLYPRADFDQVITVGLIRKNSLSKRRAALELHGCEWNHVRDEVHPTMTESARGVASEPSPHRWQEVLQHQFPIRKVRVNWE